MSKKNWTPEQLEAITTKYRTNGESCNLLLGAAAGSGKTAVLVERVIQKLIPEDITKSIDVDKLLIVTFTNAAAREMAERINAALSDELEAAIAAGDDERKKIIKKQQLLLSVSDITTIDAFCLKLLREHFNILGIEPDFSIADEAQAQLLSEEAMEELFSELYDANDEEFINLLCLYGSSRSDSGLSDLIRSIYKFTRSIPYPMKWLSEKVEELKCEQGLFNTPWFKRGLADCKTRVADAYSYAKKGLEMMCGTEYIDTFIAQNPPQKKVPVYDAWKSYYNAFYSDYIFLRDIQDADFDGLSSALSQYRAARLARLDSKSDSEKDFLKNLREKIRSSISLAKIFVSSPAEDTVSLSAEKLYPIALSILRLTEEYDKLFMQKKLAKNILEFHDAEQLCAVLLSENPDIAKALQDKYSEILMDEYQDTSMLQEEIFKYVTNGSNLFMVGDMKQSIYRFRSSDPTIFKSKSDAYSLEKDSADKKIILSKNFRSRSEVLQSVNDIFEAIMTEAAGELNYDKEQRLYFGNETYKQANKSYISECHIIEAPPSEYEFEDEDEEDFTNHALEARLVAAQINKLKAEHFKVRDGDTYRDIENRDIVILMSSFKAAAETYIAELLSAGIECFVESSGYFERNEIRLMLALLKTICNPYSDIPLLGVMRSPIAAFTDDELVLIRKCKKGRFFSAVKELIYLNASGKLTDEELIKTAEKTSKFYSDLSRWRRYSRYMSSDKLLWTLYEETDFYAFAGAMHGGEEAQANLRLLFERAKQYEAGGFEGLFNFVKYIERIQEKDTDLSSAKLVGEGHNVVRIMTIHKSKGLEFPVVFITGGGKRFNKRSDESRVLLHKDYGIAMDYIDFENSLRFETPAVSVFKSIRNTEQTSEEIRKLYVALTRAKEKLYFIGTVSGNVDKSGKSGGTRAKERWQSYLTNGKAEFLPADVLAASGFIDWVAPVAIASDSWSFDLTSFSKITLPEAETESQEQEQTETTIDITHILDFKYPYAEISDLPTKVSVSELKAEHETVINPMPQFMQEKRPDGAYYGTAVHKVMQNLVPKQDMDEAYIKAAVDKLVLQKIMTKTEADLINPQKILLFYQSDIGRRIMSSKKVYREQPFELLFPAKYIYPELENADGESIMLQGVIDCFFEEDDGIVLVDYKTDHYKDISEIHEKYDKQLELYRYALEKITEKNVKDTFIYLFFDNNVV
ncbi:MAG: helicase-exonuclease AddAB subunit AddA [Clostridia bacterium]|nr:helicase-exonuclease AddAB subunit AddA [Clostridia bacterium]